MYRFLLLFLSLFSLAIANSDFPIDSSDELKFGRLWQHIKRLDETTLTEMISQRQKEIETIKNHWKEKILLEEDTELQKIVLTLLSKGSLVSVDQGYGAAYFLCDEHNKKQFVIKPFDEDILCLNNRKSLATPYRNSVFRVRENIPLYRSAQTEALAFEVASCLGFAHLTPKTHLLVISHPHFHTLGNTQNIEKLCSIQEFIPNLKNFQDQNSQKIHDEIDFDELENLFILIWCLYDTDAHIGNLYVKKDEKDRSYLIKIDNGLCFPTKNTQLLNALYFLPQAKNPLSQRAKELIVQIPIEKIISKMIYYELEDTIVAFQKRIALLQLLAKTENISLREIDLRLRLMNLSE